MLFDDDDEMDDRPVSDDRQEGLERVFEEGDSTAADRNGSDETEGTEGGAWNAHDPGPEVLSVHWEQIVVRDVVLELSANNSMRMAQMRPTEIELKPASTSKNLPKPPAGSRVIFNGPPTPASSNATFQARMTAVPLYRAAPSV